MSTGMNFVCALCEIIAVLFILHLRELLFSENMHDTYLYPWFLFSHTTFRNVKLLLQQFSLHTNIILLLVRKVYLHIIHISNMFY